MNKRIHIFVSGFVQGVFFRASTQKKTKELDLKGWVSNLDDGRVEILAEGSEEKLKELLKWLKKGPLISRVEKVDFEWEDFKEEFDSFEIRY